MYRRRAMSFAERRTVLTQNERQMSKPGKRGTHCLKKLDLTWGIGQMIIPTDDMRNVQISVIKNRAKIIGR